MYVKEKRKTHFLNLWEDNAFALCYLNDKNVSEFTNKKLVELQKNIRIYKGKCDRLESLLSVVLFFDLENLSETITRRREKENKNLMRYSHDLKVFESNLAYLLISGIITLEKANKLGFDNKYLKNLISKYRNEIKNSYNEYYYDELTKSSYEIRPNGKMLALPYTPDIIIKELKKNKLELTGKRIVLKSFYK